MILFEFQFKLKLYFLTGHQLCARDLLSSGNTAPSHFYYDTYSDLEFYFDMVKLHMNSAEQHEQYYIIDNTFFYHRQDIVLMDIICQHLLLSTVLYGLAVTIHVVNDCLAFLVEVIAADVDEADHVIARARLVRDSSLACR